MEGCSLPFRRVQAHETLILSTRELPGRVSVMALHLSVWAPGKLQHVDGTHCVASA